MRRRGRRPQTPAARFRIQEIVVTTPIPNLFMINGTEAILSRVNHVNRILAEGKLYKRLILGENTFISCHLCRCAFDINFDRKDRGVELEKDRGYVILELD